MPYPPQGLIGGEAAGDWEVIAEVEVEADCDYVEFTGLDINSDVAYVLILLVKNPLSVNVTLQLIINGDAETTNYYRQRLSANGTSVNASNSNDNYVGGAAANDVTNEIIWIILDKNGYTRAFTTQLYGSGSGLYLFFNTIQHTVSQTNVTSIRIQASESGGIGAGSKFILARVKRP